MPSWPCRRRTPPIRPASCFGRSAPSATGWRWWSGPRRALPTLIVATQEEGYCREKGWIDDIRGYVQHVKSPIDVLAEVLQEKGLSAGRIGYEPSYLSVDFHKEMVAALPEAQFQACEKLLERVRMVKSDSEIEVLKRAAVATERALMATYSTIKPGDVESDLVARLGSEILRGGAELPAFLYLTTGPNTGHAHPDPTDYRIQPGDLVKTDCGGYFSGYYSDVARTAVLGKATPEQRSIYERIYQVHMETLDSMQARRTRQRRVQGGGGGLQACGDIVLAVLCRTRRRLRHPRNTHARRRRRYAAAAWYVLFPGDKGALAGAGRLPHRGCGAHHGERP